MFRLFECCALSFFERFVLSFSLKIERFVSDSAEIWICGLYMKLTAIGESIKNLDKVTNKELLAQYPEIPWRYVMGVRDIIVHHYFDVDADEIYRICLEDIPQLQQAIKRMLDDLKMDNLIMG